MEVSRSKCRVQGSRFMVGGCCGDCRIGGMALKAEIWELVLGAWAYGSLNASTFQP